jgi:hypothetical protein
MNVDLEGSSHTLIDVNYWHFPGVSKEKHKFSQITSYLSRDLNQVKQLYSCYLANLFSEKVKRLLNLGQKTSGRRSLESQAIK